MKQEYAKTRRDLVPRTLGCLVLDGQLQPRFKEAPQEIRAHGQRMFVMEKDAPMTPRRNGDKSRKVALQGYLEFVLRSKCGLLRT